MDTASLDGFLSCGGGQGKGFPQRRVFSCLKDKDEGLVNILNNLSIIVIFEYCYSRKLLVCKISPAGITNCPQPP